MDHQTRHALRMLRRVGDRRGATLRHSEQCKPFQSRRINHRFQVRDHRLQREILHIPIRETVASLIEAQEAVLVRQRCEKGPPNRALPIELKVREERRRPYQRR
jgi:hypothetical protein